MKQTCCKPKGLYTPNCICKFIGWWDGKRGNYIMQTKTTCTSGFSEKKCCQFQTYAGELLKHLELCTAPERAAASQIMSQLRSNPMLEKSRTEAVTTEEQHFYTEVLEGFQALHTIQDDIRSKQTLTQQTIFSVAARYRSKLCSYYVGMHRTVSDIDSNPPSHLQNLEEHPAFQVYLHVHQEIDQQICAFLNCYETKKEKEVA